MTSTIREDGGATPINDPAKRLSGLWRSLYEFVETLTDTDRTDLLQDALGKALQNETGRKLIESIGESTWSYLKICVEHEHVSRHRRRRAKKRAGTVALEEPDQIESDATPPAESVMLGEQRTFVNTWMRDHLAAAESNVMMLKYWNGFSFESIGRALGMNRKQVSEIHACALLKMKELIPTSFVEAEREEWEDA